MRFPNRHHLCKSFLLISMMAPCANAQESGTIVGKDGWLYFRWEQYDPVHKAEVERFTDLLARAGHLLGANGVHVVYTITPLKMQVYPQHLPANFGPAPGAEGRNRQMVESLHAAGLTVADQLPVFQTEASKGGEPLFLRLDSHWTPSGAMLAARVVGDTIGADPAAAAVLEGIPSSKYRSQPLAERTPSQTNDLLPTLPPGAAAPVPEKVLRYAIEALDTGSVDNLTGESGLPQITVIGSSFTDPVTQYPDAVRVALQRNVLDISIPGRQGPWVGMENYTQDTAFQLHPPKLLLWEVPERDSANPPDSPWRDPEYFRDSQEWLLNLATAVSRNCTPSSVGVQVVEANLPNAEQRLVDGGVDYGPSNADSHVQLEFTQPLGVTDYLWVNVAIQGGGKIRAVANASDGAPIEWTLNIPEDGTPIALKTRMPAKAKTARSLRLYPGDGNNFALAQPAVCQHASDLIAGLPTGVHQ